MRARLVVGICCLGSLAAASPAAAQIADYQVTVTNLTGGQPMSPPVVATHRTAGALWHINRAASVGVKEIAENGNLAPLLAALSADPAVSDVVAAEAPVVPRRSPAFGTFDDEVTLMISADGDAGSSRGNRC